jgi:CHAT domain-containing protein
MLATASRSVPDVAVGSKLRVIGLFDRSLPGAAREIEILRDLVRRGQADGVGFDGPVRPRHALENGQWDLLTVAAHGSVRGGVPLLNLPSGELGLPQLLEWTLPPVVNLGACRSAEPGSPVVPLEWVTVALRRGARSVVAARWPISDYGTARIISRFYVNLAERRYQHAAHAFWDAARLEIDRPAWWWAGLGLFGDELRAFGADQGCRAYT